jgi:hypothetical protein
MLLSFRADGHFFDCDSLFVIKIEVSLLKSIILPKFLFFNSQTITFRIVQMLKQKHIKGIMCAWVSERVCICKEYKNSQCQVIVNVM